MPRKCANMATFVTNPILHTTSTAAVQMCSTSERGTKSTWKVAALSAAAAAAVMATTTVLPSQAAGIIARECPIRLTSTIEASSRPQLAARWDRKSESSAIESYLLVSNTSKAPVDLMWINYRGEEVYYATIRSGRTHVQPTYATHQWVVRDNNQNAILVIEARSETAVAVIGMDDSNSGANDILEMVRNTGMTVSN